MALVLRLRQNFEPETGYGLDESFTRRSTLRPHGFLSRGRLTMGKKGIRLCGRKKTGPRQPETLNPKPPGPCCQRTKARHLHRRFEYGSTLHIH